MNGCRVFGTLDLIGEGVEMASVNYAFIQASIKVLMDAYCKKIITLQVEEKCVVGQGCSLIVVNSFTHWLYKNSEI